jgi:putative membrane protein
MAAFIAFLHHLAAFTLVAALVAELVLVRSTLTVENARRILRFDAVYGTSATLLLAVGLLRVFYFEKGADYYFHSIPFLAKLGLFAAIGLLSAWPTLEFLSWRKALRQGQLPAVTPEKLRVIQSILHWELVLLVPLLACAALMARGVGHFG